MAEAYKFQMKSEVPAFEIKAQSNEPTCIITSYAFVGDATGATIDPATGSITVNTESEIILKPRQLSVEVGSETIISPEFNFEVFNCGSQIKLHDNFLL